MSLTTIILIATHIAAFVLGGFATLKWLNSVFR
jgi:hypothetical protein